MYKPFLWSIHKTKSLHKQNKTYNMHKHETIFFKESAPLILPLLKGHIHLGYDDIVNHSF